MSPRYKLTLAHRNGVEADQFFETAWDAAEAYDEYRGDSDETVQEIAACLSDGEGYFYESVETGATVRVGPA